MFLKDINGKNTKFETEVKVCEDANNYIFLFKAKNSSLNSFSNVYNDDIWRGDVCEVFLADGNVDTYYEIEVAPNGTLFFGKIHFENGNRILTKLENKGVSARVFVTSDNQYDVYLAVPKNLFSNEVYFNMFRLETEGLEQEKNKLALFPTFCETFHKPEYFQKLVIKIIKN